MFPSRYVFPPVLIVRFCGSTLLHRVLISVNRSPKLNCHVERGRNKKRAIRAISPEIHVFRFFSISPYAHLPLLSVSQKKKMHSRDVASFPSFFFFFPSSSLYFRSEKYQRNRVDKEETRNLVGYRDV